MLILGLASAGVSLQVCMRVTECGCRGVGFRLQLAVLASGGSGELFVDTLKNKRARTVPLVDELVPMVDRWAGDKVNAAWLFHAPQGGPLSEGNWRRSVRWSAAMKAIGVPTLRVHDLRHTAASVWLGSGADPKVVQRILGHASAAMTMDLYGHVIDQNLWDAAKKLGGTTGAPKAIEAGNEEPPGRGDWVLTWGCGWSRLSESNRRPCHYEEDVQRRICSLPAHLLTGPPALHARFLTGLREFAPRPAPRPSGIPRTLRTLCRAPT